MKHPKLTTLLQQLVNEPTLSGDIDAAISCLSSIEEMLKGLPLHVTKLVSGDFPSLYISTKKSKHSKVMLVAHLDVVAANAEMFTFRTQQDKLIGRGVYDMKFAAASFIHLLKDLGPALEEMDLSVLLTTDEELGGQHGVGFVLKQGYSCEIAIIPDGGDNWRVEKTAKGAWLAEISAKGVARHSSRPWEAKNAASNLVKALYEIEQLCTKRRNGITAAITTINAGQSINQIPDFARSSFDVRFNTMYEYEKIERLVSDIAKKYNCQVDTPVFVKPHITDLSDPYIKGFKAIASQRLDKSRISSCTSIGASDARFFGDYGMPTIVVRPIGGGQHSNHEWISQSSLFDFYDVLKQFVQTYAS